MGRMSGGQPQQPKPTVQFGGDNDVIEVLVRIPRQEWFNNDELSGMLWLRDNIKQDITRAVRDIIVEKKAGEIALPDIKISPEEVKDKMLSILAERALEKEDD